MIDRISQAKGQREDAYIGKRDGAVFFHSTRHLPLLLGSASPAHRDGEAGRAAGAPAPPPREQLPARVRDARDSTRLAGRLRGFLCLF